VFEEPGLLAGFFVARDSTWAIIEANAVSKVIYGSF
jgi:hypothetical protein